MRPLLASRTHRQSQLRRGGAARRRASQLRRAPGFGRTRLPGRRSLLRKRVRAPRPGPSPKTAQRRWEGWLLLLRFGSLKALLAALAERPRRPLLRRRSSSPEQLFRFLQLYLQCAEETAPRSRFRRWRRVGETRLSIRQWSTRLTGEVQKASRARRRGGGGLSLRRGRSGDARSRGPRRVLLLGGRRGSPHEKHRTLFERRLTKRPRLASAANKNAAAPTDGLERRVALRRAHPRSDGKRELQHQQRRREAEKRPCLKGTPSVKRTCSLGGIPKSAAINSFSVEISVSSQSSSACTLCPRENTIHPPTVSVLRRIKFPTQRKGAPRPPTLPPLRGRRSCVSSSFLKTSQNTPKADRSLRRPRTQKLTCIGYRYLHCAITVSNPVRAHSEIHRSTTGKISLLWIRLSQILTQFSAGKGTFAEEGMQCVATTTAVAGALARVRFSEAKMQ